MTVLFFANTGWYLYNFRLELARFLRERGVEVVMMSPYGVYGPRIEAADFRWLPLPMDRRSLNLVGELTLLGRISELFRSEQPDVIHNFTIKCVVYGSLVARWLGINRRINAVTGLGHVFISDSLQARLLRPPVKSLLRLALGGSESQLILQNSDDMRLFSELGLVEDERIRLIKSSSIDTLHFSPFKREKDGPFRILLAARLLWEKGIREYVDAAERLGSRVGEVEFLIGGRIGSRQPFRGAGGGYRAVGRDGGGQDTRTCR